MKFRLDVRILKPLVCLAAVLALFLGGMLLLRTWEEDSARGTVDVPDDEVPQGSTNARGQIWYDGSWYVPRDGLELTLLLGVDNNSQESDWIEGRIYTQSDFMLLVIVDRENGRCSAIHLNRDTIGEYQQLSDSGRVTGTATGQLTLAHAYGGTEEMRCENTVDAVSRLLYGVEIDHYVSLMMDGVAVLNDLAGGVTLEVMDDFGAFDPALVQGETVTLRGEQALTYIRSRMGMEDGTNLRRMERQKQYMEALEEQLTTRTDLDDAFIVSALMDLNPYMTSDCTANQLADFAQALQEYGVSRYLTIDGEAVEGEKHLEFHVDEDALQKLVMDEFFQRVDG